MSLACSLDKSGQIKVGKSETTFKAPSLINNELHSSLVTFLQAENPRSQDRELIHLQGD